MLQLTFEKNGQYFVVMIDNHRIFYTDKLQGKIWGGKLQYLPPDHEINKKIMMSRNKIPSYLKTFFEVSTDELKEFEDAKNDEELRKFVMRDAIKNGCRLVKEEKQ